MPWFHLASIALLFLATAEGRIGNFDSSVMLEQSRSMLLGKLSIPIEGMSAVGVDGLRFSQYGILTSLVWIPFVLLGRLIHAVGVPLSREGCEEFMVSFCAPLVMATTLTALADVWRRLGAERQSMVRGLWILALGTMLWTYAKLPSSDALMALAILMVLREWLLPRTNQTEIRAGIWLGLALLSRKQAVVIIPVILLLWTLWRAKADAGGPLRSVLSSARGFAIPLGATAAVLLWYNWARFGSPFLERYPGSTLQPVTLDSWVHTLVNLCVSSRAGILWYAAPAVVAMAIGARSLYLRSPFLGVSTAALLGSHLAFLACLPYWHGGVAAGPRLFLFGVVLLALPLGILPFRLSPTMAVSLWLAFGLGIAVTVPCVLTDPLSAHSRLELEKTNRNFLSARYKELMIVLGSSERPAQHRQVAELMHPPFQVPNVWWAQVLRELRARRDPNHRSKADGP